MRRKSSFETMRKFESEDKIVGIHKDCGGVVYYRRRPSYSYRFCCYCKASSLKGDIIEMGNEK
jgi:hypothetical protein